MANHKKYSILEFAVPLGNYDNSGGYGITSMPFQGERSSGSKFGIYDDPKLDDEEEDSYEEEDGLIDVSPKIDYGRSMPRVDIGRSDPNSNTQRSLSRPLVEKNLDPRDDATTPVVKGMTPRLTYSSSNNTKGPAMSSMASSRYITTAPGRIHGTEKGTSRAPAPPPGEGNLNPIFSLADMLSNDEIAFLKFQNNVNKIKNIMEIINF